MATNFSPCKGFYVLNQFPSNVMFGMNGFHVSASGAIQGHHGPLVSSFCSVITAKKPSFFFAFEYHFGTISEQGGVGYLSSLMIALV